MWCSCSGSITPGIAKEEKKQDQTSARWSGMGRVSVCVSLSVAVVCVRKYLPYKNLLYLQMRKVLYPCLH